MPRPNLREASPTSSVPSGPHVRSVNVGAPRTVTTGRHQVRTAIWKTPVAGRVTASRHNLSGDQQADLTAHGGPDKAVYAYAAEDSAWWAQQLDRDVPPGAFGENLTTLGLDVTAARIGEQWSIGGAILEVAQPRVPCFKLALRFDDPTLPRRFAAAARPGAYLRVLVEGDLAAGDPIAITRRPAHGVTVGLVAAAYHGHDPALTERILDAPELPADWRAWAHHRLRQRT